MSTATIHPTVELRSIKYLASMSQETPCFTAMVYVCGKKVGEISNDGWGGDHRTTNGVIDALTAYANTLPERFCHFLNRMERQSWESVVDDLLDEYLLRREAKGIIRKMKKEAIFVKEDGGIYHAKHSMGVEIAINQVRNKYPTAIILNAMPTKDAEDYIVHLLRSDA